MFEQSLYGIQKELQAKIGTNLLRNPFFVPDAASPDNPAGWIPLFGTLSLSPAGAPDGKSRILVLAAGTTIESEYELPLNSGTDSATLPEEFTFTVCVTPQTPSPVSPLVVEIVDGTGNDSIASLTFSLASAGQTTQSKSFSFSGGYRSFKVRIHTDIPASLYLVSLIPGSLAPDYIAQHALTESDLQLSNANTLNGLEAEAQARQQADAAEAQARQQADTAEAQARADKDTDLQNQIDAEETARQQADTAIQNSLANYVTLTTDQDISGTKNFTQVTSTHPAAAANDLVRKADMDAAISGIPQGSYVDLSTNQSVAGEKTFTTKILAANAPTAGSNELVRQVDLEAFLTSAASGCSAYTMNNSGAVNTTLDLSHGYNDYDFIGYFFQPQGTGLRALHDCAVMVSAQVSVLAEKSGDNGNIAINALLNLKIVEGISNIVRPITQGRGYARHGMSDQHGHTNGDVVTASVTQIVKLQAGDVLTLTPSYSGVMQYISSTVMINVLPKPALPPYQPAAPLITSYTVTPSNTIQAGTSVTFTVVATPTIGLTYTWKKDGVAIAGAPNTATYTIPNPATTDSGVYTCTVNNASGTVSTHNATLTVQAAGAPLITTQPQDEFIPLATDTVMLTVVASGVAPLTYQWYTIDGPIAGSDPDYFGQQTDSLTAGPGTYRCLVTNAVGQIYSRYASIEVDWQDPNVCPAAYTLIDTPKGPIAASELKIGTMVYGYEIKPEMHRGVYPITALQNGTNEIWTLETKDGRKVDYTPGHEFYTQRGFVAMRDLVDGDIILGDSIGEFKSATKVGDNVPVVKIEVGTAHTLMSFGLLSHNQQLSPS